MAEPRGVPENPKVYLERMFRGVALGAAGAYRRIAKALEADHRHESELDAAAKHLRTQQLRSKAALEGHLGQVHLNCRRCNRKVHWVSGVGPQPGHWAHAEPAPNGHEPAL